ncbi:MAG: hypothetical protein QG657_3718 [Acidobacteriota bacterium]|nr:hypothetical protein [Acidobacteriota bacterium]
MDYSAILKWAAGCVKPLTGPLEFDEDVLINLVDKHNLSGRFMQKLTNHKGPSFTPKFNEALKDLHHETKSQVMRNINAFRSIKTQMPPSTGLIIIKGVSTYVLTSQEHTMRSGDIDLLSNDTTSLVRTLSEMAYQQTRAPFLHEIGEYTKGSIEVDIHDHFPVYGYTDSLLHTDLLPQNNPGIWRQSYTMKHTRITYDDLKKYSCQGNMSSTENVTAADPNILSVIICAHAFMNYTNMWSISHREKAYVRLGEIADLFDLVRHPAFADAYFLELVKQFQATDAVEWAANISSILFGKNPLPIHSSTALDEELPKSRFPRCLWWNFWADLPSGVNELIQKEWLAMDWLTKKLGANILASQGPSKTFSTIQHEGCQLLKRFITQEKLPIPLALEMTISEIGIQIIIKILPGRQSDIERIRIDFGHIATEWTYSNNKQIQTQIGKHVDVKLNHQGMNCEVKFHYPWELLGQSIKKARKVPVLIGVGQQSDNDGLIASTLIPLELYL